MIKVEMIFYKIQVHFTPSDDHVIKVKNEGDI